MSVYAVNGKEPIAAWIPSLDTAGNGTTTLTDLVGSNDGTLTNMDAATDWVADTDAGGVRALDFDGTNDFVDLAGCPAIGTGDFTISLWFNRSSSTTSNERAFATGAETNTSSGFCIAITDTIARVFVSNGTARVLSSSSSISLSTWTQICAVFVNSPRKVDVYVDGSFDTTTSLASLSGSIGNAYSGAICYGYNVSTFFGGRVDDIRIFDQALDATDIAYLYNSGNGRGVTPTTPNTRRRRYAGGYGL